MDGRKRVKNRYIPALSATVLAISESISMTAMLMTSAEVAKQNTKDKTILYIRNIETATAMKGHVRVNLKHRKLLIDALVLSIPNAIYPTCSTVINN